MGNLHDNFKNRYKVNKTLKFRLIPQGKTNEFMEIDKIVFTDICRSEDYKKCKLLIDDFHRNFISKTLENFKFEDILKFDEIYNASDRSDKIFGKIKEDLRTEIIKYFEDEVPINNLLNIDGLIDPQVKFADLFSGKLFKVLMPNFLKENSKYNLEDLKIIADFNKFTTYFKGYHDNRKNIYSKNEKSTSLAHRIVNENLPKFLDNNKTYNKIKNSNANQNDFQYFDKIFAIDNYNNCLTQKGIDYYNNIITGYTVENEKKVQGLNELVNLYNQSQIDKNEKIGSFQILHKQILSDRKSISWLPEQFNSDEEVIQSIKIAFEEIYCSSLSDCKITCFKFIIKNSCLENIYIKNDTNISDISHKIFGNFKTITEAIEKYYDINYTGKKKIETDKYVEERSKKLKQNKSYSIDFLNKCVFANNLDVKLEDYFSSFCYKHGENESNILNEISDNFCKFNKLFGNNTDNNNFSDNKDEKTTVIKSLLDSAKKLQWFIKPLLGEGNEPVKDTGFYVELSAFYTELNEIDKLYNKVRNYITKKPYSTEKVKLNFDCQTLLAGWSKSKEQSNLSIIFRKNNLYYLGIMKKNFNKSFDSDFTVYDDEECYEKMEYNQIANPFRDLPKAFLCTKQDEKAKIGDEILRITARKRDEDKGKIENTKGDNTYTLGDNFIKQDLYTLIDYFKTTLKTHEWNRIFNFNFSDTKSYNSINEFYNEVEKSSYNLKFRKIPVKKIDELVNQGKLYLFQIYNKDFSTFSKGTKNLHTLYFEMLFSEENLENLKYKLDGYGEIFYRKSTIVKNIITHPANLEIVNKNKDNKKKTSKFTYELTKDKRYTVDQFQIHVPILCYPYPDKLTNFNLDVKMKIKETKDFHIIGIDRGERHLLYLTIINIKGEIVEQMTLNEILNVYSGGSQKVDYHNLLDVSEKERDNARKNWETIENIKELKEGYLSAVIHKITTLMIKYNAIIVLEDLNFGFKNSRIKVEKQVYQKFEKMLIGKLNYYVDKKVNANSNGGLLNAYQLTNEFESFQKLGKQSGFLFYVPAWNTSKIDPTTGFTNMLHLKYENLEKAKKFISLVDKIKYNEKSNYFELNVDYMNFNKKAEGTKTKWTICSFGKRIETFRDKNNNGNWNTRVIDVTKEFIKLFNDYSIDFNKINLKEEILNNEAVEFYKQFIHLFKLTLQMRNSEANSNVDYLISPVKNDKGEFYNSDLSDDSLPKNADANGAFNIALKGLWVVKQIKETDEEKLSKMNLAISNKEWLNFVQNKEYLKGE